MFFKDEETSGVMALEWNREEKGPVSWVVFSHFKLQRRMDSFQVRNADSAHS